jgi:eukaryotic-like serine/threonine-protein kinase
MFPMSLCINPTCRDQQNPDGQLLCSKCGSELLIEGRYRVLSTLGEGGFAKIYEVKDYDNRIKALKVQNHNGPKHVELFHREVQVLSQINQPGIPIIDKNAYFTFFPKDKIEPLHCLAMEKITGLDLKTYVQKRGKPISQSLAIQWLMQLAKILKSVHSHHFLHRDIKPTNIMLKADGRLVLIDFGSAYSFKNSQYGTVVITQATRIKCALYTSNEQKKGKAVPQSDFFALGRTFIHLLTGKELGDLYNEAIEDLQWRSAVPTLSSRFGDFLDHITASSVSSRPVNAEILLKELIEIQRELQAKPSASTGPQMVLASAHNSFEHFQSSLPLQHHAQATRIESSLTESSSTTDLIPQLNSAFVERCQQKLTEFIGPMATIICQQALQQKPSSEHDFIKSLAKQIPNGKDAGEFQQCLQL